MPYHPESAAQRPPEQDYFALPNSSDTTPARKASLTSLTTLSPGQFSFRTSGWTQMLNPSSLSIRPITPKDRTSFDTSRTPLGTSLDDSVPTGSIPVPGKSPRRMERPRNSQIASGSPPTRSVGSSDGPRNLSDPARQLTSSSQSKVSFGSVAPLHRERSRSVAGIPMRKAKICVVRLEIPLDVA